MMIVVVVCLIVNTEKLTILQNRLDRYYDQSECLCKP